MPQAPRPAGYEHDDAWDSDWLRVDDIHEIYYQQYGKKDGKPGIYRFPIITLILLRAKLLDHHPYRI